MNDIITYILVIASILSVMIVIGSIVLAEVRFGSRYKKSTPQNFNLTNNVERLIRNADSMHIKIEKMQACVDEIKKYILK